LGQDRHAIIRILVVDDDAPVRRVLQFMLTHLGYEAESVESGARAIEKFSVEDRKFDLVMLDLRMPGMDGLTCFRALREIRPDLRALFISGYEPDVETMNALHAFRTPIVRKPIDLSRLREAVTEALAGSDPGD
jgi:CheY-like chemotaxis protein